MASCIICSKEVSTYLCVRLRSSEGTAGFVGVRLREELLTLLRKNNPHYLPALAGGLSGLRIEKARLSRIGSDGMVRGRTGQKFTPEEAKALVAELDRVMTLREANAADGHCSGHETPDVATAIVKAASFPLELLWNPGPDVEPLLTAPVKTVRAKLGRARVLEVRRPEAVLDALNALLEG